MLERALEIAREAHAEDVDKAWRPVIEHVLRVVDAVEGDGAKVVAALHDVIEPPCVGWTMGRLLADGIPSDLVLDVRTLTRPAVGTYERYIRLVEPWPRARAVKIADLRDHLHPDRIGALKPSHVERYRRALAQLGAPQEADRAGA